MDRSKWKLIRLSIETDARIDEVRQTLLRGHNQGQRSLEFDDQGRVSYNQVINILIDHFQRHKQRVKNAKRSRKLSASNRRTDGDMAGTQEGLVVPASHEMMMHPDTDANPTEEYT